MNCKPTARVNRSDAQTIQHALERPSAKSLRWEGWRAVDLSKCAPRQEPELRLQPGKVHTPTMTLKNAALFALIGTILMTALLVWVFVANVVNVLRGVDAPVVLFSSLIYAFGSLSLTVFIYVFYKAQ
jgi:hypothetical protein